VKTKARAKEENKPEKGLKTREERINLKKDRRSFFKGVSDKKE